jgi:hypothetical protein
MGLLDQNAHHLPRAFSARRGGIVVAGLLAASGGVLVWQAARLDLGVGAVPGPGFFPLLLGAMLVILAVAIGIGCWRSSDGEPVELGHRDVLIVMVALLLVPLAFEPLGALLTLGLFGVVLLALIARVALPLAAVAAALAMAGCWYFFQHLLGLQLPSGPL